MAESVVKLRLESGEYDSKIKRAAQNILSFGENCQKAGQSVAKADKDTLDYVQAIGKMETVSKTAKGKINEMTSAFTELSVQYRHLTDQEKQSPFGKALAQSLDQLKIRVKETNEEIQSITSEINGKTTGIPVSGGGKIDGMLAVFGGNMMTKAAGLAANLTSELADMVKEGIELAKAGEGIRIAFERLNRPDLLDKLREATHGTVTDLELMKQAVKFNDFNLSLEEMGTMLAFAQQKAKDTGQSVDYMVDSIVTGLGRKSLMILDNLGLSAADIKEKMKGTGDMTKAVGEIIREQMSKAGDYIETAADRAAKADAEVKNAMEELGRTFQPLADAGASLWHNLKVGALDLLNNAIKPLIDNFTILGKQRRAYESAGGDSKVGDQINRLKGSNHKNYLYQATINDYNRQINDLTHAEDVWNRWRSAGHGGVSADEVAAVKNKYGTDNASIRAQYLALRKQRDAFIAQAQSEVFAPVVPDIVPTSSTTTTKTGRTGTVHTTQAPPPAGSIAEQEAKVQALTKAWRAAADDDSRQKIKSQLDEANKVLDTMQGKVTNDAPVGSMKYYSNWLKELQDAQQLVTNNNDWERYAGQIDFVTKKMRELRGEAEKQPEMATGLSGMTSTAIGAWIQDQQQSLGNMEIGSKGYNKTYGNIVDATTLQNLLTTSAQQGIDLAAMGIDMEPFWDRILDGQNIPNEEWVKLQDTINEQLAALNIAPIKIDVNTGEITRQAKTLNKDWMAAASAIQSVGSAMQSIEDPAMKVLGTIAQAIASIALGAGEAIEAHARQSGNKWEWIAFAASATATMISSIAAVKSNTKGFEQGGIIPGNRWSGDQLSTADYGINSGELVLTRAQQGNLASQLQGNNSSMEMQPYLDVEKIWLGLRHYTNRTGKGEIVTTR